MWRNSSFCYGYITVFFHWLSAIVLLCLFASGLWMASLSYYDALYVKLPNWHKSVGILFFFFVLLRIFWRLVEAKPIMDERIHSAQQKVAIVVHFLLYLFMLLIPVFGYIVVTSKGEYAAVFNWFLLPVLVEMDNSNDFWSKCHEYSAWLLVALTAIHALGALKHHFVDKDDALLKMLGKTKKRG